jgi:hypothetical protein
MPSASFARHRTYAAHPGHRPRRHEEVPNVGRNAGGDADAARAVWLVARRGEPEGSTWASSIRTYKDIDATTTEALLRSQAIDTLWLEADYSLDDSLYNRAGGLKATTSLRSLVVFRGELKADTAKVLVAVLTENQSLKSLTLSMVMKTSVAKDVVKRLSKLSRVETIAFAMATGPDDRQEIIAAAKGGTKVVFVDKVDHEWH